MSERPNEQASEACGLVPSQVQILFPALLEQDFSKAKKFFEFLGHRNLKISSATKSISSSRLEKLKVFLDLFPVLRI